jgi:hypothetical protein
MGPVQIVGAVCVITAIILLQRDSEHGEPIIVSE